MTLMRKLPFIYIAGLRRTGTTVLSEALTLAPYSWIFREPQLSNRRIFIPKESDKKFFSYRGVDLNVFQEKISAIRYGSRTTYFRNVVLPKLLKLFFQIGIKEIHHRYWKNLYNAFPKMKVILTGRDPRDIYISLYYRNKSRKQPVKLDGPFCPEIVAENLLQEFQYQKEMYTFKKLDCLKVRYEDFCTNQNIVYARIKKFVDSPIPDIGMIGWFNSKNPKRITEYKLHRDAITRKKVCFWRSIFEPKLVEASQTVFELLSEYCEFWHYQK
ncbi:sulfotransferase [candidate division KSB3 bacterium]|uniref:Sulfotransferase n=1 Tax=candidate division KSB3 bacterium TaxID=2044937 RepID=A0A2G6E585_9BACT|nr:MAG: sulfotransferase [candidate division KSB3 bacterium]PIE29410.1 MAG: sulfotransferase [candidate division KSB3 bacterium]